MNSLLLRLLRVPPEPAPPDGSPESIRIFRAGRNYYRWRVALWGLVQLGLWMAILLILAVLVYKDPKMPSMARMIWRIGAWIVVPAALVVAVVTFQLQRLNYELRWYIVTDRSLRIRSGIWSVEEITMTFANIQNLKISRDPLQLLLGLADLEATSAGGGSHPPGVNSSSHTAEFSGVDNAEALRDLIVERLRLYRDAGLGDHEPSRPIGVGAAATELLSEARKLRAAVS